MPIIPAQSKTSNGITLTSNGDGSYSVFGTATENCNLFIDFEEPVTLPNKTLYCHLRNNVVASCALLLEKTSAFSASFNSINRIASNTNLANLKMTGIGIYVSKGATIGATFKPSVELSNEITEYEQCGASPSTNYPAKVHCVGDDKNLFGATKNDFENGETLGAAKKVVFNLKPNTQYTCSSNDDTGTVSETNIWFNGNSSTLDGVFKNHSRTVVTDENGKLFIAIRTTQIEKFFDGTYYIKLQEGTVATPWSPYEQGTTRNKSSNKNLWNDYEAVLVRGVTFNNGIYTANDNDNKDGLQYKIQQYDKDNKHIEAGALAKNIHNIGRYYFTVTKKADAKILRIANNGKTHEFWLSHPLDSIEVGEKFTVVLNIIDTTIGATKFKDVMLVKGEVTEADYVQHEGDEQVIHLKEPLLGIGDVQDELDLSNNKIIRRFAKKVLDGTENWSRFWGDYGSHLFRITNLDIPLLSDKNVVGCMCNQYKAVSWDGSNNSLWKFKSDSSDDGLIAVQYYSTDKSLAIKDKRFTTATELKAYLAEQYANGTPVEVIYELAEPVIEGIDCSDKIKQFDGQTTIYNLDGAEIECTLTNNRSIAEVNENLYRVEQDVNTIKENIKLETITKNIRGHFEFIENSDANKLTKVGLYRLTGTLTNYPSTSSGILEINGSEDIAIEQIFTQHNGKKWNRICWYGTWSSWLTMN